MKAATLALIVMGSVFAGGAAWADADDLKWVAQCLKDNQNEKASVEVITKY